MEYVYMILFAVNDAGPARYIAHIVRELDGIPYICLASDISSKIFDEFNIEYIVDENSIDIHRRLDSYLQEHLSVGA